MLINRSMTPTQGERDQQLHTTKDHESMPTYCGNSSSKESSVACRAAGDDLAEHGGGSCEERREGE
jgi:hypothetical protein